MSYRSSAGWFWPSFEEDAALPARPPVPPPTARTDRWALPASPPVRRPAAAPAGGPAATAAPAVGPLTRAGG